MAVKQVRVSDISMEEIEDGKGAVVRVTFNDGRKGIREFDVTDTEAAEYEKFGKQVARRGRRPRSASASSDNGSASGSVEEKVGGRRTATRK